MSWLHSPKLDGLFRTGYRLAYRALLVWWRIAAPAVEGAYVAVWCRGRLLVIRNSYRPGVTLPCGGIGARETPRQAGVRELQEEVGIAVAESELVAAERVDLVLAGRPDHAHFFELFLDSEPTVRIDRREVVWAAFRSEAELADEPLLEPVAVYLKRRERRLASETDA